MSTRFFRRLIPLLLMLLFAYGLAQSGVASAAMPAWYTPSSYSRAESAPAVATSRPYRVGVQVGHYKNNELPEQLDELVGSVGTYGGGRSEVDLNLDIANRVAGLLRNAGGSVDVLPATVPTGYSADAFIAIHADGNASSSPRGYKISTRWSSTIPVQDASLVETLTAAYSAATGLPEDSNVTRNMRGYYAYAPWRPNYRISYYTPGAIVEMGYMTNAADRAVMFRAPDKVASGIATGVLSFLKSAYGAPGSAHPYGLGKVDSHIDPNAPGVTVPKAGPKGPSKLMHGDWQVLLMGKPLINVYSSAGSGQVITQLKRGAFYHALLRMGDYYGITLPDGKQGWVHRNAVITQMVQ